VLEFSFRGSRSERASEQGMANQTMISPPPRPPRALTTDVCAPEHLYMSTSPRAFPLVARSEGMTGPQKYVVAA
jgi:hypothetical protein